MGEACQHSNKLLLSASYCLCNWLMAQLAVEPVALEETQYRGDLQPLRPRQWHGDDYTLSTKLEVTVERKNIIALAEL